MRLICIYLQSCDLIIFNQKYIRFFIFFIGLFGRKKKLMAENSSNTRIIISPCENNNCV